jgi:hypothetical protein
MKDFVHRTLDDMNHGRSIKEALDLLGLSECVLLVVVALITH